MTLRRFAFAAWLASVASALLLTVTPMSAREAAPLAEDPAVEARLITETGSDIFTLH